jgi:hypothetical protein
VGGYPYMHTWPHSNPPPQHTARTGPPSFPPRLSPLSCDTSGSTCHTGKSTTEVNCRKGGFKEDAACYKDGYKEEADKEAGKEAGEEAGKYAAPFAQLHKLVELCANAMTQWTAHTACAGESSYVPEEDG